MKQSKKEYDVLVVGAGFAGCSAAIAAARNGASVLIADAAGYAGGAASNNLVYPFMPHYAVERESEKKFYLSCGIFSEIKERMHIHQEEGFRKDNVSFLNETLKIVLDEMLSEAGVEILYHATLCNVEKEGQRIKEASFATKNGICRFSARVFIDTTGDADLTALAEIPTVLGRPGDSLCQPMTLCFRMGNIDKEKFMASRPLIQELYRKAQAEGKIKNPREDVLMFNYPTDGVVHFNTTRVIKCDPTDPFDVTKAEIEARKQVMEIIDFLKENRIPGFERAELLMTAPSIGVRESRMLVGEYVLTGEDLVNCVSFADSVAAGNYDLDIHSPDGSGTSHHYFDRHTWYTIPYRCLTPKKEDAVNLLVAGRCISATHEAQASVRIMPICATTGEAVGIAAALSAKTGKSVQDIDVGELQKRLKDSCAFLGI